MADDPQAIGELTPLLDSAARPVYCVDPQRHIVYGNRALVEWLQSTATEVTGRLVEYHSEPSASGTGSPAAGPEPLFGLCPPPAAFVGEEVLGTVTCADRDGRLLHRRGRFVPLGAGCDLSAGSDPPNSDPASRAVLAILDERNLSPSELARTRRSEPSADDLHRAVREFRRSQAAQYAADALLGNSAAARKVCDQVRAAAASGANVLISGPLGSGRLQIAKSIHYQAGGDTQRALVPLEGPLVSHDLMRRSLERLRDVGDAGGTLLLSDIDQLSTDLADALLVALDSGRLPVRVIATMADTAGETTKLPNGALLNRLSTITIHVPPLSERLDDLPLLVQWIIEARNRGNSRQIGGIAADALDRMALYAWPGQLEELRQVIGAAYNRCAGTEISVGDLPPVIHHAMGKACQPLKDDEQIVLDDFLGEIQRELIERAMQRAGGNKTEAAKLLGLTRPRLYRRLVQLGLIDDSDPDRTT